MTKQNAMTIDVEDYFQVSAFEQHIPRSEWQGICSRLERNMDRILAVLDDRLAQGDISPDEHHRQRAPRFERLREISR